MPSQVIAVRDLAMRLYVYWRLRRLSELIREAYVIVVLRNNTLGAAYGVVQLWLCERVVFEEGFADRSSNVRRSSICRPIWTF